MQSKYRLDTMVNRVTFDRMIEALQTFVQPMGELVPVSQAVRDVMLYSYPNSMIQVTWQEECVYICVYVCVCVLMCVGGGERGEGDNMK